MLFDDTKYIELFQYMICDGVDGFSQIQPYILSHYYIQKHSYPPPPPSLPNNKLLNRSSTLPNKLLWPNNRLSRLSNKRSRHRHRLLPRLKPRLLNRFHRFVNLLLANRVDFVLFLVHNFSNLTRIFFLLHPHPPPFFLF